MRLFQLTVLWLLLWMGQRWLLALHASVFGMTPVGLRYGQELTGVYSEDGICEAVRASSCGGGTLDCGEGTAKASAHTMLQGSVYL